MQDFPLFYCSISATVIGDVMVLVEVTYKRRETVQSVRRLAKKIYINILVLMIELITFVHLAVA